MLKKASQATHPSPAMIHLQGCASVAESGPVGPVVTMILRNKQKTTHPLRTCIGLPEERPRNEACRPDVGK